VLVQEQTILSQKQQQRRRRQSKQDYPRTEKDYQETYEKLQAQESNRLTISSFLGGLTFAAFAAFEASPIKTSLSKLDLEAAFALGAAISLGVSTLIFLAAALSAYQSLRHLGQVSQDASKELEQYSKTSKDDNSLTRIEGDLALNEKFRKDFERISSAWRIHEESEKAINLGFAFLILALIFVGLEVNYSVGIIVIVALLIVAYYFRTVRNMLTSWMRAKVSRHAKSEN
jgi:hypothetical protein